MLVLVDHAEAKVAIHCYDELREIHKACPPDTLMT